MDVGFWQGVWTLAALVLFLGIVIWTFSPRRRRAFERAARMPLEEDEPGAEHAGEAGAEHAGEAGAEPSPKERDPDG